jgi:hypothetical protein
VILLELTGDAGFIVPLMIAILAAKSVSESMSDLGIYQTLIQHYGYPYLDDTIDFDPNSQWFVSQLIATQLNCVCFVDLSMDFNSNQYG